MIPTWGLMADAWLAQYLAGLLHGVRLAVRAVCAGGAGRGAAAGAEVLVGGRGAAIGAARLLLTTTA